MTKQKKQMAIAPDKEKVGQQEKMKFPNLVVLAVL
jgi:hypothetical protein